MPFKSVDQERAMWANAPDVARKWEKKYGSLIHKQAEGKKKEKSFMKKKDK